MQNRTYSTHILIRYLSRCFAIVTGLLISGLSFAHTGHDHVDGMLAGISHPIGGLDHLLAMLGVGIWAAQTGGQSRYFLPLSFVTVMLVGGVMGISGLVLPFIEEGILASVLVIGVVLSLALKMPAVLSAGLVGFFAIFHGYAHGAEMPVSSAAIAYMAGFALSTATLHLVGIIGANTIKSQARQTATRITGLVLMLAGTYLAIV